MNINQKKIKTMKHVLTLIFTVAFFINSNLYGQFKIKTDGKIGIGTLIPSTDVEIYAGTTKFNRSVLGGVTVVPLIVDWQYQHPRIYPNTTHTGYIGAPHVWYSGTFDYVMYYVSCTKVSDIKFKKNIKPLNNSLEKVLQLNGVKYDLDFATIGISNKADEKYGRNQMGLIAQDVMKIVPEVVRLDSVGLGIDYTQLIPLLIEAIKEQNARIITLESKITDNSKLKSTGDVLSWDLLSATLGKNIPNPFDQNTSIEFCLPSTIQKAVFYVYDFQGKQIKSMTIAERGQGNIIIEGSELMPGIYYYSLIVDGMQIGIEKMILTD